MASAEPVDQPADVANKVLRRAQVSKMTRALQNRLALANVKIKHGWENMSLDTIEPKVEMELKRKRPSSSHEVFSDTSSSVSDRFFPLGALDSSPLAPPIFSDDVSRSGSSHGYSKRVKYQRQIKRPASSSHARAKVRPSAGRAGSWKSSYRLPESSPVYHSRHARFHVSQAPSLSFVSEASTIPDSPSLSEEDDEDLPVHSFQVSRPQLHSSPPQRSPRTPPPGLARSARLRSNPFGTGSRNGQTGQEDANLLMHFAASPSPARPGSKSRASVPSTPPSKSTPLPSSMMTPGGAGSFPFGLSTPGTNLNFADFLNMSPSPAQAANNWTRTPITGKTPVAAREARRRLNFDSLVPPSSNSPSFGSSFGSRSGKTETGLGMDLGGELVS